MSFVNEIVREDDIDAYKLDDVQRQWNGWSWRDGRPVGFVHDWVIDRGRDAFLMEVKRIEEVGPSGRPEPTSRSLWLLYWQERWIDVLLKWGSGSSRSFKETPYRIRWELSKFDSAATLSGQRRAEAIQILKEALRVYGYAGARKQIANTEVLFDF